MFNFDVGFDVDVNVSYAVPPPVVVRVHHKSGISLYFPVLGFALAGAFFLLVSLWFLCCFCLKARLRLHGMIEQIEVGEVLINGESVQPVEDHTMDVDHPIWYIRTQGLQQSIIDSISIVKFRKNEGLVEGSDCSICLSEFEEDESLRLLPKCEHAFHVPCIDQWFQSHKNCPLCRSPIANVTTMAAAPVEENQVGLEEQQSDEMVIGDINVSHEDSDLDSSVTRTEIVSDKDSSLSGSSNAKRESDITESHSLQDDEVLQPMRRSASAGPVTSSNLYNAVAEIKINIDSNPNTSSYISAVHQIKANGTGKSMKRSASYGGKPSSAKSGRSLKSILPY